MPILESIQYLIILLYHIASNHIQMYMQTFSKNYLITINYLVLIITVDMQWLTPLCHVISLIIAIVLTNILIKNDKGISISFKLYHGVLD